MRPHPEGGPEGLADAFCLDALLPSSFPQTIIRHCTGFSEVVPTLRVHLSVPERQPKSNAGELCSDRREVRHSGSRSGSRS